MTIAILLSASDLDIAARTLVGEASGEPLEGRVAVAWTLRSRALWQPAAWWGANIADVCQHPEQYDCWMPTLGGQANADYERIMDMSVDDPQYQAAEIVVRSVMAGDIPDPTFGSTTYKRTGTKAFWDNAVSAVEPIILGHQSFWRLSPTGPCLAFLNSPLANQVA